MYLLTSRKETFGKARSLSQTPWKLNACPMDGGMLTVDRSSQAWAAYRRKSQVFTWDGRKEHLLGDGEQPTLACLESGTRVLWTAGRVGNLLLKSGEKSPVVLDDSARDPVVAASPSGKFAVAAWEDVAKDAVQIRALRLD